MSNGPTIYAAGIIVILVCIIAFLALRTILIRQRQRQLADAENRVPNIEGLTPIVAPDCPMVITRPIPSPPRTTLSRDTLPEPVLHAADLDAGGRRLGVQSPTAAQQPIASTDMLPPYDGIGAPPKYSA
ncbi:hypothetical protein CONPUDRAFT_159715 [Coniophora puteana RWD-64-598 SS2]|uniref:Uncharacterized protein n=1 Tax=Coniophora puteana (strain RWD-64-598) TaxID=741705 RepID=A0A5M3M8F2_CONPW|nr:uncharacterized protein CONPUDRAFT_159715 [Coniophora puteana RWD-64-598 SS2]EIW74951.1 hypothetical protein CONPUDRAFT_159715 [Coniophora puteana RWD-64-598 SS2]